MRVFYIFKIKNNFYDMYKDKPYKIYMLLSDIHNDRNYGIDDNKRKLKEIIEDIDVNAVNNRIIEDLYSYKEYYNKENVHIICDNYEYTKLVVDSNVIGIKSNQKYPIILDSIVDNNIFICDFVNREYFFLEKALL